MKNIFLSSLFPAAAGKTGTSVLNLIGDATIVGKIAMLMLAIFSIISWAVIIFKLVEYGKA
ncbi:MAG: hypothetical protein GY765_07825, partial [bacterium]|nr:hypothetical protein [bacterium]